MRLRLTNGVQGPGNESPHKRQHLFRELLVYANNSCHFVGAVALAVRLNRDEFRVSVDDLTYRMGRDELTEKNQIADVPSAISIVVRTWRKRVGMVMIIIFTKAIGFDGHAPDNTRYAVSAMIRVLELNRLIRVSPAAYCALDGRAKSALV